MEEKRKFVRLEINVAVKWKKIPEEALVGLDVTKNISKGGICLMVDEKLEIGDNLELEIEIPEKKVVQARVKVIRVRELKLTEEGRKEYEAGVEFFEISDEDREEIEGFICAAFQTKSSA